MCPSKPCETSETCAKLADWIVEGRFEVQPSGVWLRDAKLVAGTYRWMAGDLAYIRDASPTCWKNVLPVPPLSETATHLVGKRVRAYGTNMNEAFVEPGVLVLEVVP